MSNEIAKKLRAIAHFSTESFNKILTDAADEIDSGYQRGYLDGVAKGRRDAAEDASDVEQERKYLLFAGENYYPAGGIGDYEGDFASIDAAKAYARDDERCFDWWHIVDRGTMKRID